MCSPVGWWDAAWAHGAWTLLAALWQAWLTLDRAGLGVCSDVAHGTEVGRAVSQDVLVFLWSQSFPSSLLSFWVDFPLNLPRDEPVFPLYHFTVHGTLQIGHGLC